MKKTDRRQSPVNWVVAIRTGVYIVGILAFFVALLVKRLEAIPIYIDKHEAFWPPDFIPHPMPPWDDPRENKEGGEMADRDRGPIER